MAQNRIEIKLTVKVIKNIQELKTLEKAWNALSKGSCERSIYNDPGLLVLWWKHFSDIPNRPFLLTRGFEIAGDVSSIQSPYILTAYAEKQIVGILPLALITARPQNKTKLFRCVTFLGDPVFSPAPTITYKKEFKEIVFESFSGFLDNSTEWDYIFLAPIRDDFKELNYFVETLIRKIKAKTAFRKIQEIRFLKKWDKDKVCEKLDRLITIADDKNKTGDLRKLLNSISSMDNTELSRKCLNILNPRIKSLLDSPKYQKGTGKGIVLNILEEISPTADYIYQVIPLPDSINKYDLSLSKRKRYELRKDKRSCDNANIKISFEEKISKNDFDTFTQMHRKRHPHSAHLNDLTMNYYSELIDLIHSQGMLRWVTARLPDGRPLFFILCFLDHAAKIMRPIIYGSDKEAVNFNLGNVCIYSAIEKSIEFKFKYFDFRMGSESYKTRFNPDIIDTRCFISSRVSTQLGNILPKYWKIKDD